MRRRRVGGRFMNRRGYGSKYHAPKHFTEVIQLGPIISPNSNQQPAANAYNYPVTGNMIKNLSQSLVDVYKQYCITGLKLMYIPAFNTYSASSGTSIFIPKIYYAEDKASYQVFQSVPLALQQDNLKIFDSSKKWTHYIKNPRAWLTQYLGNSSNETPAVPPAKQIQWLMTDDLSGDDTSGLPVQHLHSAIVVEANSGNSDVTTGTLWARVYYACKEQR